MQGVQLYPYQLDALKRMRNGCILDGKVGSGKSITGLAYYYTQMGGQVNTLTYRAMNNPVDLYIITTARKRDTDEWEKELANFGLDKKSKIYHNKVVVDSWNNIRKYVGVKNAFFLFDEQRAIGRGVWAKSFIMIAKTNQWIILSATPGDNWMDYVPVFIANGFFRNYTEFVNKHVIYNPFVKFRQVQKYVDTGYLIKLRKKILVEMDYERPTEVHEEEIIVEYDRELYRTVAKERFNIFKNEPIQNASEFCYVLRQIVNSDRMRLEAVREVVEIRKKVIIFYSYDYELELLRKLCLENDFVWSEWNGHVHQPLPSGDKWVYLVNYAAGAEGWNCIETDTILFYSLSYSYKTMKQSAGRIDRVNTPFKDLYYYKIRSRAPIDLAIQRALSGKKQFNEAKFYGEN